MYTDLPKEWRILVVAMVGTMIFWMFSAFKKKLLYLKKNCEDITTRRATCSEFIYKYTALLYLPQ